MPNADKSKGGRWVYVRKNKNKPNEPGHWKDKKKLEVVTTYLGCGNVEATAKLCNVPSVTIHNWKRQDWWKELIDNVQSEENMETSSKLSKIVAKSIDRINDILDKGEYKLDTKTGKIIRIPPSLRDVHRVTTDLIDKQAILKKTQIAIENKEVSREDRLLKLAETFAQFALGKTPKEEVVISNEIIEGEYENIEPEIRDALHDERATKLQEGTELGAQEQTEQSQGSCQTESGEESGSQG